MKKILNVMLLVALVGFLPNAWAEEKADEPVDLVLEKVEVTPPSTIDFRKELGLDFTGLMTIGARIEMAMMDSDPVSLAVCGLELKAAEAAAGKTASLTSKQLMDKAYTIALFSGNRQKAAAMKALMPEKAAELDKMVALMENEETARGFQHLEVTNNSHKHLRVYVDHQFVGTVDSAHHCSSGGCHPAHKCFHFPSCYIHHTLCVEIKDCSGRELYHRTVSEHYTNFRVTIN